MILRYNNICLVYVIWLVRGYIAFYLIVASTNRALIWVQFVLEYSIWPMCKGVFSEIATDFKQHLTSSISSFEYFHFIVFFNLTL